jgi:hypothetical protein
MSATSHTRSLLFNLLASCLRLAEQFKVQHDCVCGCVPTNAPGKTSREERVWPAMLLSDCFIVLIDTVTRS